MKSKFCKCGELRDRGSQRYCCFCHAAYMREWRKTHPLTSDQKRKVNSRSYANVYLKRGKLLRKACECCGEENSQIHHPDYDKPLKVVWLCRSCHLKLHKLLKNIKETMVPRGTVTRSSDVPA